jgi:tetratricopeptide (TPR) repeat protein
MRRALAIDEKNFGSEHPDISVRLNNLAQLLHERKSFKEAEPLMRRALAIDEKILGLDHPNVAIRLTNLARLLHATKRLDEAEPLMRRHVAIFVELARRTGYRHPHFNDAFGNYCLLLTDMGKSQAEIDAACAELMRPLGDNPSG